MRNLLAVLICVLPACGAAFGDGAEKISHWDFDGSLKDACGPSKDNLSVSGRAAGRFVTAAEVPGVSGKALALGVKPGDAGCVSARTSVDVKLGASYTISTWVLPTKTGQWNRLVLNWGAKYAYHLAIHNGMLSLYHGQAGGDYVFAEGGRAPVGSWSHLTGVARRNDKDPAKSTLEVYINGKLVDTSPYDGTIATLKTEGLGVGDQAGGKGGASGFRGYIDELSIWNRPLSAEEISKQYAKRADTLKRLAAAATKVRIARIADKVAALKDLGVKEIVFAERHPGRDPQGHYYANFGYSCGDENLWIHGKDGGRLCKLNGATGRVAALLDDPKGSIRDPQVSYDAKKVLFSYRKGGTHYYNLYEIDIDGKNLRPITKGA